MIINHRTQRRYVHGGSGIFDIIGKIASKVATKTPEMLAKAQANQLINKITKEVVKQGEKALVDQSGNLAKAAVNKIAGPSKDTIAKQKASALINSLGVQKAQNAKQSSNLSSLISGMGLKPIKTGRGIVLD